MSVMRVSVEVRSTGSAAGSVMVKVVPLPGLLSTRKPAAHRRDERARLEGADAEAAWLCRGEGLEQAVADEVAVHADASIGNADRSLRIPWRRRGR